MAIKLGSIVVDLTANTVSFSNEMTKASQIALNSSKNIQRSLTYITAAATAMAAGVVASLTEAISKGEDFAYTMQHAAQVVGTSSEMFSKLAYSAKLSGTPLETLQSAMERLSKTAGAARSGSKEQAQAFAALGISVKDLDGPLKDADDLTVAIAYRVAHLDWLQARRRQQIVFTIMFTASDCGNRLRSGYLATVEWIGEDQFISAKLDNGKTVKLDHEKACHIDHS